MIENRSALSYISSRDLGARTHVRKNRGFAPRPGKPAPRHGRVCPACGMERSVAGFCECNE